MEKIISVIPNLCEGKNKELIDDIAEGLRSIKGLVLLDISMDSTRTRTVFAFTGKVEAIFNGGFLLYERALKDIDMRTHKGEYPRIGALDVFPFVPIKDATIEESVDLSVKFAEEVAERFNIPIYLFAESSRFPIRKDIDHIRECEYEGLESRLKDSRWRPDLGPDKFNSDFGATIIGARHPLVSFK
ncbi:MAG: glutamate formiminotransferase, partial [Candidatus Aminicenantes bacterium]|nr:glutamate formiminotransferase [Candidatus Aminicenantes bacterium]